MLQVCCAIIEKNSRILLAQRSAHMRHPLCWEFPGGKILPDESAQDCIIREIMEELHIHIEPFQQLPPVYHDYGDVRICLIPFRCTWKSGKIILTEHQTFCWTSAEKAQNLNLASADIKVLNKYLTYI